MSISWNPWHGCHKLSQGCKNCYVYRVDARYEKDSSIVSKNKDFDLPIKKKRNGEYKISSGQLVYTCFTSDFFLEDADEWRKEAWKIIKERSDLHFLIITKRIDRFNVNLPDDWDRGYDNVEICCTTENQDRADYRLPIFLDLPIKTKSIICEPLLEKVDLTKYLNDSIRLVVAGGESGNDARICDYDWILSLRKQCIDSNVNFYFKQTGAKFIKKGKFYRIKKRFQHSNAQKANINYSKKIGK